MLKNLWMVRQCFPRRVWAENAAKGTQHVPCTAPGLSVSLDASVQVRRAVAGKTR